ncbi:anti-sigma factor [Pseudomonas putida]|uniref:anti-sigma factor n=1 Tax=Pseudomonas putida TaxID=303 RepID=UPI0020C36B10|nr:anti-sigma factor [Pseudomonas putida]UTL79336.1 anti-sigma factor [Pseudomonas putida]
MKKPQGETADALDELAGEYVLGTLSAEQHEAVRQRLTEDQQLRGAVDAWEQRLLALNALAEPLPPSPRLWGRISRSVDAQPQPQPQRIAPPTQSGRWWHRLVLWQGLAGAGLVASLLLAFTLLTAKAPEPSYLVVLVAPADSAPGWVVQASDTRSIQLIPLGQFAVPSDKVLQFWTKGEQWQAPLSLGLVKPGEQYRVPAHDLPPLEPNQLFELTLERAGGSPTGRPTGPVQFIGRAVKVL